MSTNDQRRQWADHIADEARELQVQQRAAGQTHSPTEGPLPFTADQLEDAVRAAVDAERERCAAIADAWSAQPKLLAAFGGFSEPEARAAAAAARAIGSDIRRDVPAP